MPRPMDSRIEAMSVFLFGSDLICPAHNLAQSGKGSRWGVSDLSSVIRISHRVAYHTPICNGIFMASQKTIREKTSRLSDLQPIVGDELLGADANIDGFKGSALAQAPQLPRNGRTADPEFPSHVRRERPDKTRLRIDAPPKILHYALTKVKRNLRRTPPRIPCRSMCSSHSSPSSAILPIQR